MNVMKMSTVLYANDSYVDGEHHVVNHVLCIIKMSCGNHFLREIINDSLILSLIVCHDQTYLDMIFL